MFNDCHLDGRDAGAGGGMRRVIAWVVKEEGTGGVFILDVVASDGAAAYPIGTTLRRRYRRYSVTACADRLAWRRKTRGDAEQLDLGLL